MSPPSGLKHDAGASHTLRPRPGPVAPGPAIVRLAPAFAGTGASREVWHDFCNILPLRAPRGATPECP